MAPPRPLPPADEQPRVRVRMTVAYDGSGFRGFAHNPGVVTVAGALREALAKVLGETVDLTCAGRTDAGVHAWGQVVHFDVAGDAGMGQEPAGAAGTLDAAHAGAAGEVVARGAGGTVHAGPAIDLLRLHRSLNAMLAPKIVVREVVVAAPGFDARRSATGRRYRYTVLNRPLPDPFIAPTSWHVAEPLDLRAMQLACDPLIGEHDWSSFCRKPALSPRAGQHHPTATEGSGGDPVQPHPPRRSGDPNPAGAVAPEASMVRIVRRAGWVEMGDGLLRFDIEASAFCHQMVRSLVGTLVAVGRARIRAGDMAWIIRSRDRSAAAQPAPPHGLCLWEVLYQRAAVAGGPAGDLS